MTQMKNPNEKMAEAIGTSQAFERLPAILAYRSPLFSALGSLLIFDPKHAGERPPGSGLLKVAFEFSQQSLRDILLIKNRSVSCLQFHGSIR